MRIHTRSSSIADSYAPDMDKIKENKRDSYGATIRNRFLRILSLRFEIRRKIKKKRETKIGKENGIKDQNSNLIQILRNIEINITYKRRKNWPVLIETRGSFDERKEMIKQKKVNK